MSHTQVRETQMTNVKIFEKAAKSLKAEVLGYGTHALYAGKVTGFAVRPRTFQYPVVLTDSGELKYDTFNGRWGNEDLLKKLEQHYSVELVKEQVQEAFPGAEIQEQWLENGEYQMQVIPAGVGDGLAAVPDPDGL